MTVLESAFLGNFKIFFLDISAKSSLNQFKHVGNVLESPGRADSKTLVLRMKVNIFKICLTLLVPMFR